MSISHRVLLIDDHELVRLGFKRIIDHEIDLTVVAEASNIEDAKSLIQDINFDIAVIDLSLPDGNGLTLIEFIKRFSPCSKLIVLSMYDVDPFVSEALNLGVNAYLSKRTAAEDIINAIRNVNEGASYLSKDVVTNLVHSKNEKENTGYHTLTDREKHIFKHLALGKCPKQVAHEVGIATKTVHTHRRNICEKLKCATGFELTRIAFKLNIIAANQLM